MISSAANGVRRHPPRIRRVAISVASMLVCGVWAGQAQAAGAQCPGNISWVHAAKVGAVLSQDTGLPHFYPKKHINRVTYVGRFVMVPQIGVVAGLPHRAPVIISGLDAPTVRIASRVHEVEWRMVNTAHTPLNLKIVAKDPSGSRHAVVQCQLKAPKTAGKARKFAYLRLFWKPTGKAQYEYQVQFAKQKVVGAIKRGKYSLRYGQ